MLLDLPPELVLRITSLLEVRDLLALRISCRFIHTITQDKLLWRTILRDLPLPLPRALRSCNLDNLSYPELEKVVLDSLAAEHQWLKPRGASLTLLSVNKHSKIHLLDFLDDRWVISILSTGPTVWDTREHPPKLCELSVSVPHGFWDHIVDAVAGVDPHQGDVIIGLRKAHPTPQVVRVHLAELGNDSFQLTAYGAIDGLNSMLVALEPPRNAIITELPDAGIQIGDWTRGRTVEVTTPGLNDDHVFQPLLGLRLVGDYVLFFRSMWIELLPIPSFPDANGQPASENCENGPNPCRFHLKYPDSPFTGASLSEPQPNPESLHDSCVVYILAQSTLTGFFYFRTTIYNSNYVSSGPGARMDVDLVGVHELRKPQVGRRDKLGPCLALRSWLGPEGKRGIWIERPITKLMNFVVAVSFDESCPAAIPVESGDDLQELCEIAPRIESTEDVFIVESWNPHDDIVRCAFSEATGKIVLGTRDNRIILL